MVELATIDGVVSALERLKRDGRISAWELPYARHLKRLEAAVFFIGGPEPREGTVEWEELCRFGRPMLRRNEEQLASRLEWEVRFARPRSTKIGSDQIRQFKSDGYVVLDSLLSEERVQRISRAMDRIYDGIYNDDRRPENLQREPMSPFGNERSVRWMLNSRLLDSEVWDLATDSDLGEIAARLLGAESVSIIEDQLLDKPPQGLPVNMHQDYAYWPFSSSMETISCWISLVDDAASCGGLAIVSGSHRWGLAGKPEKLIEGSEEGYWASLPGVRRSSEEKLNVVNVDVPKGGAVYFHGLTVHGSPRNSSQVTRRACSLHWAGDEARAVLGELVEIDHPYLFEGIENGGALVNTYMPRVYPSYAVDRDPR